MWNPNLILDQVCHEMNKHNPSYHFGNITIICFLTYFFLVIYQVPTSNHQNMIKNIQLQNPQLNLNLKPTNPTKSQLFIWIVLGKLSTF